MALETSDATPATLDVIDVSGLRLGRPSAMAATAAAIDRACREVGFFVIVGHGVDDVLRRAAFDAADALFDLDPDTKDGLRVECPPGVQRGYSGLGGEAQALASGGTTPPDLSESFAIGSPARPSQGPFAAPSVWPPVEGFEETWTAYRAEMIELARDLLRGCALALEGRADAWDHLVRDPIGSTRANHYPAMEGAAAPDQWRGGAHTDYGTLTVLATDGVPGLEILVDGRWRPIEVPTGALVVNIGDLLARLSDDRWRSTWHRVATPAGPPPYPARTSIAHFQFPDHDAVVPGPPGEGTITAGQYLVDKLDRLVGVGTPGTEEAR